MSKITAIGAVVMDTLVSLESYPTEDTKVRALSTKSAGGGPAGTGIVAASKLGAECSFIGNLSEEEQLVFVSRYWFVATEREIAEKLGMSRSGVSAMLK